MTQAILDDYKTAPIDEKLRAMLGFLEKITRRPDEVTRADGEALRAAGLTDEQIEDAVIVCGAFNMIVRLADAFEFDIPSDKAFELGADSMLERGYL